jgi:SAM-dependent methyltransferase
MNPQPLSEPVVRRYREAYGADYCSYELANEAAFLRLQQLALADAGFDELERDLTLAASERRREGEREEEGRGIERRQPRVLDVGCATGALLEYLRERGWQVSGAEISPSAEYARVQRGLEVWSLPLEEIHLPPDYFDLILASHLIEHLNSPASFVREAWRILRPGGRFLVTTPNIAGFQARLLGARWRSAIFDHLYLFSARTLKPLLANAGFTIEGVYTWGGIASGLAPPPLKKCIDRAAKGLGIGDVMLVRSQK